MAFVTYHEFVELAAATSTAMPAWQTAGLFVGIPLTVCAAVTAAVYIPDWRRQRSTRTHDIHRTEPGKLAEPAPRDPPRR